MNGDEVILPRRKDAFKIFVASHHATQPLASLFVMRHPLVGTQFGGVWAGADGLVRGFGKDAKAFGSGVLGYHYVGLLLLSSRVFKYLPEGESNILYDALTKAIAAGETVRAHVDDLTWFETGNSHDFLEATGQAINLLQSGRGLDAELLRSITGSHWPTGLGLQPGTQILKMPGAQVSDDAKLNGFIVADHGSRVAAGARLENCVLMPGADVEAGLAFNNQIIRK
jgi:mannose-1-phosphate guanylyltransferase